jgi:hypothetical protein
MEERGELSEDVGAWGPAQSDDRPGDGQASDKREGELRARIRPLARKIIDNAKEEIMGSIERVGQLNNLEADLLDPLSTTLADQLFNIVKNKTESPAEMAVGTDTLEEMSSMAGGAVEGAGSPWINLRREEDE